MTEDDDEKLAAWLDGALPPEEAEAFAAALEANPELAAKAEAWRANDHALAGAFFENERPIDEALLARLGLADAPAAANDNPRRPQFGWLVVGSALAFTLRPAAPGDELSDALERTASLASVQLTNGPKITPQLTVRAADGRWCREFRAENQTALACREGPGHWVIEANIRTDAGHDAGPLAMAGGADPAPLDAAYQRLKASDPVSPAEERALIGKGWKP